jgi:DNA-binding CsgD family transcriptional regulator
MIAMTDLYSVPGSAEKVSESLAVNPQARALFDANIAYFQGRYQEVYSHATYFLSHHTGVYAVAGAGVLLCLGAIWKGDHALWLQGKHHIAEAPTPDEHDREIYTLTLLAADTAVVDLRNFPDWFRRGNFECLPPDAHPMAKVVYGKWLYYLGFAMASGQYTQEGVQGLALMRMVPNMLEPLITQAVVDKTVIPEIYLRLYCALAYYNSGDREMAVEHIDKAVALALPDRLFGILAMCWLRLDQLLEERLMLVDPEAARQTRELYRTFLVGQEALARIIRNRKMAASSLTVRELEVAKLVAFGFTNKQVARKLGIQESTIKTTVQKIMQKTGVTNRADFVLVI